MSTYLVAFVVGPLEATEPVVADGVALRVVHIPGKEHLTAPAIECAAHALSLLQRLLRHPLSRPTSSTSSRCPTSPPARWRTSAA